MAGLLGDGWDSPQSQGLLALASGMLQGNFGRGVSDMNQTMAGAQDRDLRRKLVEAEMQQRQLQAQHMQQQMEEAQRARAKDQQWQEAGQQSYITPEMAQARSWGPMSDGGQVPEVKPGFDQSAFMSKAYGIDPLKAFALESQLRKEDKDHVLTPGSTLVRNGKVVLKADDKPEKPPSAVQEYEYGQKNPDFNAWDAGRRKAGATNIGMPRIDIKMGDSIAGQVGPMAKDSKIQAGGAVKMFDAADRIEKALASGNVSAGPLTTQIQTVKQFVQKVSGGNDDKIRQTRQVIKSLAQMAVEARKQLQGQGQVTESEAAAVAKADAGDINDLTIGELQDLATLTKRAAHYTAKGHQDILTQMGTNEGTKGAAAFYQVPGMDALLKHTPQFPQIGAVDIHKQADAILNGGK